MAQHRTRRKAQQPWGPNRKRTEVDEVSHRKALSRSGCRERCRLRSLCLTQSVCKLWAARAPAWELLERWTGSGDPGKLCALGLRSSPHGPGVPPSSQAQGKVTAFPGKCQDGDLSIVQGPKQTLIPTLHGGSLRGSNWGGIAVSFPPFQASFSSEDPWAWGTVYVGISKQPYSQLYYIYLPYFQIIIKKDTLLLLLFFIFFIFEKVSFVSPGCPATQQSSCLTSKELGLQAYTTKPSSWLVFLFLKDKYNENLPWIKTLYNLFSIQD